ncbi:HNH endonuclease signature motif containing protein [Nocardioides rotundus]|uniref:HNH endonuclease signature motif containing protein n=1 Tax=Nocardioides rotundus TaxID=1774216 RepID=UPI0021DA2F32|nr:HNH endonuclease signature motif containing protein [Nocardioides rotundus]
MRDLAAARAQLDELTTRVLAQAETVMTGMSEGATSATNWWAHHTRTTRAEAHRMRRFAEGLDRHPAVRERLAEGDLRVDQAAVICEADDGLPEDVADWVPTRAVAFLLEQARDHDAKALRVLSRCLLEVIDPVAADAEEARRLEAEENAAREAASFTITDDGHGRCDGRFTLPTLHGQMLLHHLTAIALSESKQPSHAADGRVAGAKGAARPPLLGRHQLGHALMTYVETRPPETVPASGGVAATVIVTMTMDSLLGGLQAASLDTGGRISAGEARRLACRAGIIPAVLDGASMVLDLGRRRRLHTQPQRIALGIRDRGCTAAGCDAPPSLCHAHHEVPWSHDGGTSLDNGRLLCPRHHHRIHDPAFGHSIDKHGKVRFSRRT